MVNFQKRSDFSIQKRLILSFITVVLVFTIASSIQILFFFRTVHDYNEMLESILLTNSINEELKHQLNDEVRDIVFGRTPFESGTQYEILSLMNQNLDKINIQPDTEQFKDEIIQIREAISTSNSYIDQLGEEIKHDVPAAERNITYEYITISTEIIDDRVRQLLQSTLRHSEEVKSNITDNFKSHLFGYAIVYLLILLFSTILIWYTSNEVIKPIDRLRKSANKVAKGDLTDDSITIDTFSKNEIGKLNQSLKLVYNMLRNIIQNIKNANIKALQTSKDLQFSLSENRTAKEEMASTTQIITNNLDHKKKLMKALLSASDNILDNFHDVNHQSLNMQKNLFYLRQLAREGIVETKSHSNEEVKYSDQAKRNFESISISSYQLERDFHHYTQELQSTIKQMDHLKLMIRDLERYSVSSYSEMEKLTGLGEEELTTSEEAEEIANTLIEQIQTLEDDFKQYHV